MISATYLYFLLVDRTLAVGADIYRLEVTVRNKGDDAYNAKLHVIIPKGVKIRNVFRVLGDDVSCAVFLISGFESLFCIIQGKSGESPIWGGNERIFNNYSMSARWI